ncbi:50S ribosomal protein L20 [bacterium]|nr:50S ribosomal protein L20 [bacterium]
MSRVKGGVTTKRRKKKIFKMAKGYRLGRKNLYRHATEQVDKSLQYSYRDRRKRKSNFRSLWITRINAAARLNGLSYSQLMNGLKKAGICIDRKILADLAISDTNTFSRLAEVAKNKLEIFISNVSCPSAVSSSTILSESNVNSVV